MIESLTRDNGFMLTQRPIKMEALMVETKQKLTRHEKRRAEREYKEEKGNQSYVGGRGKVGRPPAYASSQATQPPNGYQINRTPISLFPPKPAPQQPPQQPQMNLFPQNLSPGITGKTWKYFFSKNWKFLRSRAIQ